jgi:D-alanyl-D-alanine carboxypeptidase (penicillin-binding protein 5/6)
MFLALGSAAANSSALQPFAVNSRAALVMDLETGQIIYAQNIDEELPPASISKLIVMYIIFEAMENGIIRLEDKIPASANAHGLSPDQSQLFLGLGEALTVRKLLYSIATISANDAAIVLAERIAGSESAFVDLMNQRARDMGLTSTKFTNVHGLHNIHHVMSARDIAVLSRNIILDYPQVLEYSKVRRMRLERETRFVRQGYFDLDSTFAPLIGWRNLDGLKTGWTPQAGRGITATAMENDRRYVVVVLGAETVNSRAEVVRQLFNDAFANFTSITPYTQQQELERIQVQGARVREIAVGPSQDIMLVARRGSGIETFREERVFNAKLKAPLKEGDVVGSLNFYNGEELVSQTDLVLLEDAAKANFMVLGLRFLRETLTQLGHWLMDRIS